jgi:hypothetical protein
MLAADTAAADEQFLFHRCPVAGERVGWMAVHRTIDMAVYWEPAAPSDR